MENKISNRSGVVSDGQTDFAMETLVPVEVGRGLRAPGGRLRCSWLLLVVKDQDQATSVPHWFEPFPL